MIGERLQELRKDKGVSQAEIAELLGVTHYTISSYECNRSDPDDNLKIILAKYFDVSVDYLLGLIDEPFSFMRDSNTVCLPSDFDDTEIQDIKNYINYIAYKKGSMSIVEVNPKMKQNHKDKERVNS